MLMNIVTSPRRFEIRDIASPLSLALTFRASLDTMVSMSATVRHLKAVILETTLGDDIDFTFPCYAFSDPLQETYFLRLVSASRGGQESVSFRSDIREISTVYNRMMGCAVEDKTIVIN